MDHRAVVGWQPGEMRDAPDPRLAAVEDCVIAAMPSLFHFHYSCVGFFQQRFELHHFRLNLNLNLPIALADFFSILLLFPNPGDDDIDDGCHEPI